MRPGLRRLLVAPLLISISTLAPLAAIAQQAGKPQPLVIQDQGSFAAGGTITTAPGPVWLSCRSPISTRPALMAPQKPCTALSDLAFTGAPRVAFACIEGPEDANHQLFLHAKNNLAAPLQGLGFRLEQTIVAEGILGSRVFWDTEPVTITANQALAVEAARTEKRSAEEEAEEFLRGILADGQVLATDVQEAAKSSLISLATLRRTKRKLKVHVSREGFGPGSKVFWSIGAHPSIDAIKV